MEYDAVIIGAGIGGLSSALKLASAGKKVLVLEKEPLPGGFATGFIRKGYHFESSLHCVDGLAKDGELRRFLDDAGVSQDLEFIPLKEFGRMIFPEHDFVLNFRKEDFSSFLKKSFPGSASQIDKFFQEADKFYREFDHFSNARMPVWFKLLLSPVMYPRIIKTSCSSFQAFMEKFIKDGKAQGIISALWGFVGLPPQQASALYFLIVFRGFYLEPTTYVKGGYCRIPQAMVKRIKAMGSEVRLNTSVKKIILQENGRIKGALTDKDEEINAKVVISNINPMDTFCRLIDDKKINDDYARKLSGLEKSISAFQVYLGLKAPTKELGMSHFMYFINSTYDQKENFDHSLKGNYEKCLFSLVDHSQLDPGLVPPGKGSLLIFTLDNYANWQGLSEEAYKKKKEVVAGQLISRAEKYLPGLSGYIEVMEVATPRTMERYVNSPGGAIYGFAQSVAQSSINRFSQNTKIPGLILAGAWTQPGGGAHGCFVSGIEAGEQVLKLLK